MEQTALALAPRLNRYHFLLRRLHSLTGIVPIGVFLMEHLLTNFAAVAYGASDYNRDVGLIFSLPWLAVIEWTFIFLPLAFHGGYGLFITFTGQVNVGYYPYRGNIRYVLHRVAGLITVAFLIVHLLKYRFHYLLGGEHFMANDAFRMAAAGLSNPWVAAFYVVGILAVVYHFANGVWTALITWGVTLGQKARRKAGYICAVVGIVLGILGLASVYWFHRGLS